MMATGTEAAAEPAQVIAAGRVGVLGDWEVGVGDVYVEPLRAELVFWTNVPGAAWESTQTVMPGQVVFAHGALYRVQMAAAGGGSVDFAPTALSSSLELPSDAVILAAGGRLRVDGPAVTTATDVQVLRWLPDEQHPQSVEIEYWPAKWGRAGTKPEDVKRVELARGAQAQFGRTSAAVVGLQGASADHPAWAALRLSHGGPGR
jgi:hypothetical protein